MKHEPHPDSHHDVSTNTIFGFWVYLMTDAILFSTLFATYAVLRDATAGGPSAKELFNLPYVLAETLVLLASSFACGLAMAAVPQGRKGVVFAGYGVAFLLGVVFLVMVGTEFCHLAAEGRGWERSAFLTSYFTLVGTHALHILFGLLFMAIFLVQVGRWGLIPVTVRRLACLKLFWFFSYLIWIFMFTLVYLIGAS